MMDTPHLRPRVTPCAWMEGAPVMFVVTPDVGNSYRVPARTEQQAIREAVIRKNSGRDIWRKRDEILSKLEKRIRGKL